MSVTFATRGLFFFSVSLYHLCHAMTVDEICERRCLFGRGGILCNCNAMHFAGKRSDSAAMYSSPSSFHTDQRQMLSDPLNSEITREVWELIKTSLPTPSVPHQSDRNEMKEFFDNLRATATDLSGPLLDSGNRDKTNELVSSSELGKLLQVILAKHRPQSHLKKRSVRSADEQLTIDSEDHRGNIEGLFDNGVHLRHP